MSDSPDPHAAPADPSGQALAPATDDTGLPADYDPADYRWVPVRRRPRYDGWTEEKQRRFIEVLADTGLVGAAAKAVGMTRETAYRLRRSAHGAAFARAWDEARHHAGGLIEDIAFERAIEGVLHEERDDYDEVVASRRVYNDRLLQFLLRHLRPDRYGGTAAPCPARPAAPSAGALAALLKAMEPLLPLPPEQLLDPETLAHEVDLADVADGVLPHFLSEQRPVKSDEQLTAEAREAQQQRGKIANARSNAGEKLSRQEFIDMCRYLDPKPLRPGKRDDFGETLV